jgi:hypothetical protein
MAAVMAAVMRSGRAFSGGATTHIVGDVGGGRDGASQPFGSCAIMIAHARVSGRFSTVGPVGQRQAALPAVNACGARGSRERGPLDL